MNNMRLSQLVARLVKQSGLILLLGLFLVLPASVHAAIDATSFAAKVDFGVGNVAWDVAVGDLDGDGKPDLVVSNNNSDTISVLRNTSSGSGVVSFTKTDVSLAVGNGPVGVAIGDVIGDSKPDIIVANYGSSGTGNTITVFQNNGSMSFVSAGSVTVGTGPRFIAVGDLDGDGKLDLAVTNFGNDATIGTTVSLLRNTSSGSLSFTQTTLTLTGGKTGPLGIALGDLNGDTKLDLAVTVHGTGTGNLVAVWRNTSSSGSITFDTEQDFGVGTAPVGVAIGDLDGDNKHDLVVANNNSASGTTISVLQNTGSSGNINFASAVSFTTGTAPYEVVINDFDGDGKRDVAVTNWVSDSISVFQNTSSGSSISLAVKVDFATADGPLGIAVGDFDGDTKPDIATANYGGNSISVLRNTNSPYTVSFSSKVDFATGNGPIGIAIGDLDGDTKLDLAVAALSANQVSVLRNTSTGTGTANTSFAKTDWTVGTAPYAVAIADFDKDGKLDLAVTNSGSGATGTTISVLRNLSTSGNSSFASAQTFNVGTGPIGIVASDFDQDGWIDLAVTNYGSSNDGTTISVLRNTSSSGNISFATQQTFTVGTAPWYIAAGDLDGDNKPDLAVANYQSNSVSLLRNTSTSGSISFAAKQDLGTGTGPIGVLIADLNGDGKRDLAVTNNGSNSVSVWRNTTTSIGSILFDTRQDFSVGTAPRGISAGDVGGDGLPDLVVTNFGGNTVSVLRNASTSSGLAFAAKLDFATGTAPQNLVVGAIDLDGKLDIAVTNFSDNNISVLLGTTNKPTAVSLSSFSALETTRDMLLPVVLGILGVIMLVGGSWYVTRHR